MSMVQVEAGARKGRIVAGGIARVLDLLMPPQCALCRAALERPGALCGPCWARVDFIERPWCARLGLPFPFDLGPGALSAAAMARAFPFDRVRSAAHYRGAARELVLAFKFGARVELAAMMAGWMARAGAELVEGADLFVPVPMHWMRLLSRRHNHAALLARRLGAATGVPAAPDLLARRRNTPQQTGLSAVARARNLSGAIAVREAWRGRIRGASAILVDDVFTTGSTAEACARVLKRAGAARVDVLTFARVVGDNESAI